MLILITYDVATSSEGGARRLRKVAKECVNYGHRVQNSVFECNLDSAQFVYLQHLLEQIIDKKQDSLRFYNLGKKGFSKVTHIGVEAPYDSETRCIL